MEGTGSHERQKATGVSDEEAFGTNAIPKYKRATTCGLNFFRESLAARCQFGCT